MDLPDILAEALRRGASDVHLLTDQPPAFRVDGRITPSPRPKVVEADLTRSIDALLDDKLRSQWQSTRQLCFSRQLRDLGFFRFTVYSHLGRMEASIRVARSEVPTLQSLGLPETMADMVRAQDGLILVTGPTGVGKTTTLNALLGRIAAEDRKKVITIEDPVEFVLPPGRSLVVQQQVGLDAPTFRDALIHALRQDPDVICVGEMRDLDTIATALTAAETGHLVLATLHTTRAAGTISRIIDVFPAAQQSHVRIQLAHVLRATLSQRLLPRADGGGRALVYELMLATDAVRNVVRDNKLHLLDNVLTTGAGAGMVRLDNMVRDAWLAGEITYDTALGVIGDASMLEM